MKQILLVRHGQASFGRAHYDQLSELGTTQAQHLGRWWLARDLDITHVAVGAMQRHAQSAAACMAEYTRHTEPEHWTRDAGFNEYNHQEVLARHRPEFADPAQIGQFVARGGKDQFQQVFTAAIQRWMAGRHDAEYSETWLAFRTRCINALHALIDAQAEAKTLVVFTSGGTISALCQYVLGFPDTRFFSMNWSLVNAGVTRLLLSPQGLSLAGLNNFAHLEVANHPTLITFV